MNMKCIRKYSILLKKIDIKFVNIADVTTFTNSIIVSWQEK